MDLPYYIHEEELEETASEFCIMKVLNFDDS